MDTHLIGKTYATLRSYKEQFTGGVLPTARFYLKNRRFFSKLKISPEIKQEWKEELSNLKQFMPDNLPYPNCFAVSESNALFLYNYVRVNKPEVVVETGVANGFSSRFIIAAMRKNCAGKLYSVDISNNVGPLVPEEYRSRWELVIGPPKTTLVDLLSKLPAIDVFLHDSDHSEENMLFEISLAYPKVSKAIISDDVQCNEAFVSFAKKQGVKPIIYLSLRKAYGLLPAKSTIRAKNIQLPDA
jgi:predicted O-methyltransferase YrrM